MLPTPPMHRIPGSLVALWLALACAGPLVAQAPPLHEVTALVGDSPFAGDPMGVSVAVDGDTLAVGAFKDDSAANDAGAVHVFVRSGFTWVLEDVLVADDAQVGDQLGIAVALSGDTLLAGAYSDDDGGSAAGAAYVFVRDGGAWSLSLSGVRILIGSYTDPSIGAHAGSAYVFVRGGGGWTEEEKLVIDSPNSAHDQLGYFVALAGDLAVVSAWRDLNGVGSVHLWERSPMGWSRTHQLSAPDAESQNHFGSSVATDGARILVGAQGNDGAGIDSGAAYLFENTGGSWAVTAKLTASDAVGGEELGLFVDIDGRTAVAGAPLTNAGASQAGSAYAFELDARLCLGTACPCGNDDAGGGCRNSTGRGGRLVGPLTSALGDGPQALTAVDLPPGNLGLVFVGDGVRPLPAQVGDGHVCVGGQTFRYAPRIVGLDGTLTIDSVVAEGPLGYFSSGGFRYFQTWTRDVFCGPTPLPCPSPCGTGSNVSNASAIFFHP